MVHQSWRDALHIYAIVGIPFFYKGLHWSLVLNIDDHSAFLFHSWISPLRMGSVCPRSTTLYGKLLCPELVFEFPCCHGKQKELATWDLQALSDTNFDTCVAAIDGLLIWMDRDLGRMIVTKLAVVRKKFIVWGSISFLNMIGTVDSLGRFLEAAIPDRPQP